MEKEGLKPLFDISDLAIMGLSEIIPSIPKVLRHIRNTVDDIVRVQPDVVVTIDSWSFASRVQKVLRRKKPAFRRCIMWRRRFGRGKRNVPEPCINTLTIC